MDTHPEKTQSQNPTQPKEKGTQPIMQFHQIPEQPHTYIVEDDNHRQLGTVDEFHKSGTVSYVAIRFDNKGTFEQKEFSGFTAALEFAGKRD